MIAIDGSYGEGGGQILRTSLSLSLVTGKPFRIDRIRSGRKKPGLMRQHLTSVNAARDIGNADVTGNSIGSQSLSFNPGNIQAGDYRFSIGTAGSCTLVLQTVLPALIIANGPSEVILEGGTHNPYAPPFDFLTKAFLPIVERMGPKVIAVLEKPGFYPAGGGRIKVNIQPADSLKRVDLLERGQIIRQNAFASVANLPLSIAHRELNVICKKMDWNQNCFNAVEAKDSQGPGNILTIEIESEHLTEIFTGFGERGVSAEKVANRAINNVMAYLASNAPVGKYLADQLLVPMAMVGGGRFRTQSPTKHTITNIEIIKRFLDCNIKLEQNERHLWDVDISAGEK